MSIADEVQEVADYWSTHPDPDDASTWGGARSFAEAKGQWKAMQGDAPAPPTVPGPPSPGAGMAAARAGDSTNHGATIGPVTTGVAARVLIGNKPAACLGDSHVCPMFSGPKAHAGGVIVEGSATVTIGGKPVARVFDATACSPEPGSIATGEFTVLIGD